MALKHVTFRAHNFRGQASLLPNLNGRFAGSKGCRSL